MPSSALFPWEMSHRWSHGDTRGGEDGQRWQGGLSHCKVPPVASRHSICQRCHCDAPPIPYLRAHGLRSTLGDTQAARTDCFSLSELNASRARGSNHSVNSLPGPPATCGSTQGSVVSWAQSFETLLQDRVAVTYFTVSAASQTSVPTPVRHWQLAVPRPQRQPGQQLSLPHRSSSRRSSVPKTSISGRHASASSRSRPATRSRYWPLHSHSAAESGSHSCWEGHGQRWRSVMPASPRIPEDPCSGRLSRLGVLAGGIRRWM